MQLLRRFLPVLLASHSLGSLSGSLGSISSFGIRQASTGGHTPLTRSLNRLSTTANSPLTKADFLALIGPAICKMSTSIKDEVDRQKEFYDSLSLDEKRT